MMTMMMARVTRILHLHTGLLDVRYEEEEEKNVPDDPSKSFERV